MDSAVELINVCKQFPGGKEGDGFAVDHLNLMIAEGEFFSLLGPSGCGKTTTLRMIAGFETPTSGEIFLHGNPMTDSPPFHRPVNTVFQNYALFPHLTVFQNVAFGLEMESISRLQIRRRVMEMLELVKLEKFASRYPRQLSGGQQQRVALARALVKHPQVLLLDEPLGALDLKLRKEMQLELKQMQKQVGITFIYVTHDQEEALTMSDRIGVMYNGRLLQVDSPFKVYEYPATKFVAEFIGESNFLKGKVVEQNGDSLGVMVDEQFYLQVPHKDSLTVLGQEVSLAIRPEKVSLSTAEDSPNSCKGVIKETIYLGTDTRYLVELSPKMVITVRSQNTHANGFNSYPSGTSVQVVLPPESLLILPPTSQKNDCAERSVKPYL